MNGYIILGLLVVLPASIEGRTINGDFRNSYHFVDANGKPFIATYSADNEGFHQEDNTPEPPTHSRAVQAARDNHFQRWEELAGFKNPGDDIYNIDLVRADSKKQYYRVQPREWKYRPTTPKPPTHSRAVQAARDNHFRRWEELAGFKNPGDDIYNRDLVRADSKKQYYQVQPREWKYRPTEEKRRGKGFHQVDNTPKFESKTPTYARDVQAARDYHFQRWEEEAGFPNPNDDIYNRDLVRS